MTNSTKPGTYPLSGTSPASPYLACRARWLILALVVLTGCVTVSDGNRRITATGNAKITITPEGDLIVENTGIAEAYDAIARAAGTAAGVAAKTAVKP